MAAKKKSRICVHRNWNWKVLKLMNVHNEWNKIITVINVITDSNAKRPRIIVVKLLLLKDETKNISKCQQIEGTKYVYKLWFQ